MLYDKLKVYSQSATTVVVYISKFHNSGYYPPKYGIKIGRNSPSQFWAKVPPNF